MRLSRRKFALICTMAAMAAVTLVAVPAPAATDCTFTVTGSTMRLDADCTTDASIPIPDGMTLEGLGRTITAVDPPLGNFKGAVVANGGATAHVRHLTVQASGLANVCQSGADRLRGIMFDGASGSITHTQVLGINKGASGCQEGNAIEVRNAPFDGSHPGTVAVEVAHNVLRDWQKTGIVANGDVDVDIHHNDVGPSATQANLAPNGIQLGFGALGSATLNKVAGNQWFGTSFFAGTAMLVFASDTVEVSGNKMTGNADIGLFVVADGGTYELNRLVDQGADHPNSCCDTGIWDAGTGNTFNKNHVRGFDTPFDPGTLPGAKNKALPSS